MPYTHPLKATELWFHGTTHHFDAWENPPTATLSQQVFPHSFISLSSDIEYAKLHQGLHGNICAAMLSSTAKILDLRIESADSLLLYQKIKSDHLGAQYYGLAFYSEWLAACQAGSILRFIFRSEQDHPELFAQQEIARKSLNEKTVSAAVIYIRNFTRRWIETLIGPAKKMGYDAVICNELERSLHTTASTQLFVFNPECLSAPNWEVPGYKLDSVQGIKGADEL